MDYTLVGLDFGTIHTGIAIASSPIPEPIATVLTKDVHSHIDQLTQQHSVTGFVVGVSEGDMAAKSTAFAQKLADQYHLPVYLHDETLTSQETRHRLAAASTRRSVREAKIDHIVAAAILQDFLDTYPDLALVPKTVTIIKSHV